MTLGDRPDMRDYDVDRSFRKFINPAIVLYFVISTGAWAILSVVMSPLMALHVTLFVAMFVGFILIFGAGQIQDKQMKASHHGYNVQENSTKPFFWFGTQEYKRYRKDVGGPQGMVIGQSSYGRKLDEREREQREMPCEICGDEPGFDGGYFVETRRLRRFLSISVDEEIVETDAYCAEHKPDDFQ